jgi:hypothetical protein
VGTAAGWIEKKGGEVMTEESGMYKIEKGIPIPPKKLGVRGRKAKYPLRQMEVDDSFSIPAKDRKEAERIQKLLVSAARIVRPRRFTTRRDDAGVSIWRIE